MFSLGQWRNVRVGSLAGIALPRTRITEYNGIRMPGQVSIDSQRMAFIMKRPMMPNTATQLATANTTYTAHAIYPVGAKRDYTRLGLKENSLAYPNQPRFITDLRLHQPIATAQTGVQFAFGKRISSP